MTKNGLPELNLICLFRGHAPLLVEHRPEPHYTVGIDCGMKVTRETGAFLKNAMRAWKCTRCGKIVKVEKREWVTHAIDAA
jgi:hypothetical protein